MANVNFEFIAELELIGFDFTGIVGYRDDLTHVIIDARNDARKTTLRKVAAKLDSISGGSDVSEAILNALEYIGVDSGSEIVLYAYFYYNERDGACYSFEMGLEAPEADKFKFFAIREISISVSNFNPPWLSDCQK